MNRNMPGIHTVAKLLFPTFSRDISQLPKYEITALKLSRKKLEHKKTHNLHIKKASLKILPFEKLVYFSLPSSKAQGKYIVK